MAEDLAQGAADDTNPTKPVEVDQNDMSGEADAVANIADEPVTSRPEQAA